MSIEPHNTTLKVLIADDHWIARTAVVHLLPKLGREIEVIEASDAEEAISIAQSDSKIGLIVLDLNMPGREPLQAIPVLREVAPQAPIVVMTVSETREDVLRSLQQGAVGYVPKTAMPETILSTFSRVLAGEVALPQRLLVSEAAPQKAAMADDIDLVKISAALDEFTPRQKEIFTMLATGAGNKDIAQDLSLSINTVRVHMQAITSKLKVSNRATLSLYASRWKERLEPCERAAG